MYVFKWSTRMLCLPFLYLLYGSSFLFLRNKDKWLFVPHNQYGFSDNCKYFFLHVSQNEKEVKAIWLTKNKILARNLRSKGYKATYYYSLSSIWLQYTAGMLIYDSFLYGSTFWLSGRSKKINLWHGVGLKKADHDIKKGRLKKIYNTQGLRKFLIKLLIPTTYLNSKIAYFITTSHAYKKISASAFQVPEEKILVTGYPRNDIFFNDIKDAEIDIELPLLKKIRDIKNSPKEMKVVLYMPTFRDADGRRFQSEVSKLIEYIESSGRDSSMFFILKVHPNAARFFKESTLVKSDLIYVANSHSDMYPILKYVDVLVTDYSSISSDYLLLDRPIVFFPYDIEKYVEENREFYFDYEEYSPGLKAYSAKELITQIKVIIENGDSFQEKRQRILPTFHEYQQGGSAQRVVTCIRPYYEKK